MATWSKSASIHPLSFPSLSTRGIGGANASPGRGMPMPPSLQASYGDYSSLRRSASSPIRPAAQRYASALRRDAGQDVLFFELFGAWDAYPSDGRDDLGGAVSPASLAAAAAMTSTASELRSVIALEAPKIVYDAARATTAQLQTASKRDQLAARFRQRQDSRMASGEIVRPPPSRRAIRAELGAKLIAKQQAEEQAKRAGMGSLLSALNAKADAEAQAWADGRAEARKRERANARAAARQAGYWGLPVEDNQRTADKEELGRQRLWEEAKVAARGARLEAEAEIAMKVDKVRMDLEVGEARKHAYELARASKAKLAAEARSRELEEHRIIREQARQAREELCEEVRVAEETAKRNAALGVLSPAAMAHAHERRAHVGADLADAKGAADDAAVRAAKARAAALAANEMERQRSHEILKQRPRKVG